MAINVGSRLKHAWNAFFNKDPTLDYNSAASYSYRPDRPRFSRGNERTIVTAVYNRIALDVAAIDIRHIRLDENERYTDTIKSDLNSCLTESANIDQTGRAFIQDVVISMLDEGCVAIVPVETSLNPNVTGSYDITQLRTGKILEWMPRHVRVRAYNDKIGEKQDIIMSKEAVSIVENPFYSVMNEPNSTLQRLLRKLVLLDYVDETTSSGKLDLIIQLPYTLRNETKKKEAEQRRKQIENQLSGSKYGIAYIDGTEHITQLNRSVENNLLTQIEYLTRMLYSQLGITENILNGSADEQELLNYYDRTIEPILAAITDEMKRKFLTKTARSQNQSIAFFRDPFKLVTVTNLADAGDKMTRNEIMTPNEMRQVIGMKPSKDPSADELRNRNISQSTEAEEAEEESESDLLFKNL